MRYSTCASAFGGGDAQILACSSLLVAASSHVPCPHQRPCLHPTLLAASTKESKRAREQESKRAREQQRVSKSTSPCHTQQHERAREQSRAREREREREKERASTRASERASEREINARGSRPWDLGYCRMQSIVRFLQETCQGRRHCQQACVVQNSVCQDEA